MRAWIQAILGRSLVAVKHFAGVNTLARPALAAELAPSQTGSAQEGSYYGAW